MTKHLIKKIEPLGFKKKRCRYCRDTENLTIDHKIPKIKGGSNNIKNLQCLCRRCNTIKSSLSHGEVMSLFKWFIEIQRSRLKLGKTPYGGKDWLKYD